MSKRAKTKFETYAHPVFLPHISSAGLGRYGQTRNKPDQSIHRCLSWHRTILLPEHAATTNGGSCRSGTATDLAAVPDRPRHRHGEVGSRRRAAEVPFAGAVTHQQRQADLLRTSAK